MNYHFEIAVELLTVSEQHRALGNVDYADALKSQSIACYAASDSYETFARILATAEEAL